MPIAIPPPPPKGIPDSPSCPAQQPVQWVLGTITRKQAILGTQLSLFPAFSCVLDQTMRCNACHSENAGTVDNSCSSILAFGRGASLYPFFGSKSVGRPENCSAGGGGGGGCDARQRRRGGLEKWGSVSGPLFCVRMDVGAEGAGTQILARKSFFHQ